MSNSLQPHGLQHARLPVHHQLLELAQTHVHRVGDVIQPSHPLSFPSPADLPNPEIKPACPALTGGFFTTEPTGKTLLLPRVQFSCSVMSSSLRPHGLQHTRLPCPSPTPKSLLKFMSIELVMSSNHLILCRPLLLLLSIFPSIRVFSSESALCIRWPKYWSFSFSVSPFNEC